MSFSTEKSLRVYDDNEGVYLELSPNPDFPDSGFTISTANKKDNEDWYGKVDLPINSKEHALALAKAIVEMAETIK